MHRDGAFGLSAIFVSNVIIPGRRLENQPDGLSPTTARTEETNEEGKDRRREREGEEEAKVQGKGRRSGREKLRARFHGTKRDPRELGSRLLLRVVIRRIYT